MEISTDVNFNFFFVLSIVTARLILLEVADLSVIEITTLASAERGRPSILAKLTACTSNLN